MQSNYYKNLNTYIDFAKCGKKLRKKSSIQKCREGNDLPTAEPATKRYKGSKRVNSTVRDQVTISTPSTDRWFFGFDPKWYIGRYVNHNQGGIPNDTTYYEYSRYSPFNPFADTKTRQATVTGPEGNRQYMWFDENGNYINGGEDEYRILQRRFNEANQIAVPFSIY